MLLLFSETFPSTVAEYYRMGFTKRLVMVLISLFYCSILVDSFPAVLTYDGFPTIRKQLLNPTGQLTLPETAIIHPPQINPGIAVGELYPSHPPLVGPAAVISDTYTIVAPQKPNGPDMGAAKLYPVPLPQQVLQKGVGFADSVPRQNPVSVKCHAATIEVIVNADLYSTGTLINGSDLRLGLDALSPSSCFAIASGESEFTIHAELKECGTKLWFTPDALIYTNNLIHSPVPLDGVVRLEGVVVPIECHYGRRYNISNDLQPTWVPFIGTSSAEETLDFSLMLMSSDWLAQRSSSVYFPGEMMYFEASLLASRMSLRVFVDYCIATLVPDWTTHPQYSFIENYGCLTDAKRTGSCSLFQPRSENHKLRFQLEAFRFSQQASPSLYITCHLKAVPVSNMDFTNKACSFIEDGWKSVDGNDGVCNTCQLYMESQGGSYDLLKTPMSNGGLWKRQTAKNNMAEWHKAATVGPVAILPSPGGSSTNLINRQACWDFEKQRIALNGSVSTTSASITTIESSVSLNQTSPDELTRSIERT